MERHWGIRLSALCLAVLAIVLTASAASSQQPPGQDAVMRELLGLPWQQAPAEARIGDIATIKVPDGLIFLDSTGTRRFLELNGNPPRDNRYTLSAKDFSWFAIFFFENSGYVKDDEKLDHEELLKSLQQNDKPGNEERKKLGMTALHTDGWHVRPHYDAATKRLEWGVRLRSDRGGPIVNYTVRLLGRRGVMHATLVSDPQSLDKDIAVFKSALANYDFVGGERYAEFRSGDRIAEYGLGALVLGGAAAVATKTGFGKSILKLLVVGGAALVAAAGAVWRKLSGRPAPPAATPAS